MTEDVFVLPASFQQRRMWFLAQLEPEAPTYNMPGAVRIEGKLNPATLEKSLNQIIRRHEILRTTFEVHDGEPMQVIASGPALPLPPLDLSALGGAERAARVQQLTEEEARRPMDLAEGPLLRAKLLRLGDEEHVLLLTMHHIIADGWSVDVLMREMALLYDAFSEGKPSPLPELAIQYADYTLWQREWLQGEVLRDQLAYWRRQFGGDLTPIDLPASKPRPPVLSFRGASESLALREPLAARLREVSQRQGATLFMALLAAFKTLLYKYSQQSSVTVGTPVANRNQPEIEDLIGFFVNTLALRTDFSGNPTFTELLGRVRETALGAYAHQDLPFEMLVDDLRVERDLGRTPLFQVMFVLQKTAQEALQIPRLRFGLMHTGTATAKFDLTLAIDETQDGLRGSLSYRTDLFDQDAIGMMLRHFENLLESVVADPNRHVSELSYMSVIERRQALFGWNDAEADCSNYNCLHELFEEQVRMAPDAIAVVYEDERLSYRELHERANQLSRYLQSIGIGPEVPVGVLIEKSPEAVTGILAVLKAGGVCVPVDYALSEERPVSILEEARMSALLTMGDLPDGLQDYECEAVCLDRDWDRIATQSKESLDCQVRPENLACVLFASGPTGSAKGIAIEHRQLVNYVRAIIQQLSLSQNRSLATVSTIAADLGDLAIYLPLCTGSPLHLVSPERASDPRSLAEYLRDHRIDALKITPSSLTALMARYDSERALPHEALVIGGETLSWSLVEKVQAIAPEAMLFNHYSPSETAVGITIHKIGPGSGGDISATVPIGRPLRNTRIYLLDLDNEPVFAGGAGELCVGGAGVARCHLDRQDSTAEKFVPDPFSNEPGARLYRTGDLARHLRDGNIEFLGRVDHWAKIRGGRGKPGETDTSPNRNRAAAPATPVEEMLASIWSQVLNLQQVGTGENFFEIGGHSLLATQVIWKAREVFGISIGASQIFETPTIAGLGKIIEAEIRSGQGRQFEPIAKVARNGALPLSSAQQRLWFLDQLEPNSALYNLPAVIRLTGSLDTVALEKGLEEVTRRHESLRTIFEVIGGEPSQVIAPSLGLDFEVMDLEALPEGERGDEVKRQVTEEARRPFNLARGPLMRAKLLRLGEQEHVALLTMHHIVSDEWSMGILIRELAPLYNSYRRGQAVALPELPIQYADYATWQREWLKSEECAAQLAYWKRRLAGAEDVLELPTDKPRPVVQTYRGAKQEFVLREDLSEAVKRLGQEEGSTLFMTLLAAFQTMLYRYTQQRDISVGSPIAGRNRAEIENLIGCFMNMLVIRADFSGLPNFRELLRQVREAALGAYVHQDLPFEKLVEEIQPRRDLSHSPLFQAMFALNHARQSWSDWEGVTFDVMVADSGTAKFDLVLWADDAGRALKGALEYNTDLFDHTTVARMLGHYTALLEGVVSAPDRLLSGLQMLTESERRQLLVDWNGTRVGYAEGMRIHQLIEAQAKKTPDVIAAVFGDQELTYRQLNERADRLANHLRGLGVRPDIRVGFCAERSIEMIVGLLGILKAGAAYVPIDPAYPKERIAFILDDAQVHILLTQERLIDTLPRHGASVVLLENDAGWRQDAEVLACQVSPGNLAYVIYTSGSTGQPKGVMISHENVVNFFTAMDTLFGGDGAGTWLALTSVSFDISVLELLWTLARGFKVVILSEQNANLVASKLSGEASTRKIDFSLFYFASDEGEGAQEKYKLLVEGAKFADRHGFAAVWTPERHFHAFGGVYPNPSVTSAAIATITERIEIRAGSVVLPLHNPIRIAEEWAVVDNLSNGRVGISFASGWHANDFVFAPDNYEGRKEIMLDNIETVRRLWRGESVRRRGGAGSEVEVSIRPRPVQKELPVWLTAAGSPDTFRIAGEIGAGVLTHLLGQSIETLSEKIAIYRESRRKHHPDSGDGRVTLMLHAFIGEDREIVREKVRGPFSDYLKSSVDLIRSMASSMGKDVDSQGYSEDDMQSVLAHAFDRYFETSGLFGTPDDCLRMIERLKSVGVDEVACLIDFGVETESVLSALRYLDVVKRRSENEEKAAVQDISPLAQMAIHQVTHLQCTPSMAQILKADPDFTDAIPSLRRFMVGGEALPVALANELRRDLSAEIINMYGPTETTVWSSAFAVEKPADKVPIGKPVVNTEMFILDRGLEPVPIGAPGDLYIGGVGVARGYLGRSELSAERFMPDPFSQRGGGRLYRTGDRARRLEDGNIEFLGRDDHQVKIDGHRIELGEIEAALALHEGVREAVVVVREDAPRGKRLVAYVVADQLTPRETPRGISQAERERLLAGRTSFKLPNGMVVAHLGDLQTNVAYREVFGDEIYLRHAITLNDGDCVFDVGANIGFFTLFANQKRKDLRIFAFEPIPPTFDVLQTNVALYGLNAKLYQCGLSNKAETAEFTFYPSMAGLSGRYSDGERDKKATTAMIQDWLKKNTAGSAKALITQEELDLVVEERFRSEKYVCQLMTLSEVIREHSVERIDLLKIDVERSEYDVLCGIEGADWKKIKQIVMEVDTRDNLDRITALLERRGYDVTVDDFINVEAEGDGAGVDVFMLYARRKSAERRQTGENGAAKPALPALSMNGLREFLKKRIPEYMIPSSFMFLDGLPLTPNGKVDRKSLPEPGGLRLELETSYVAPQTMAERTIAAIWQEALGVERVGVRDNFFEAGGTSLLLVQLNNKLREAFKTNIPMVEMFRHTTISSMANYLTNERDDATSLQRIQDRASKQAGGANLQKQFKKARQRRRATET